ncbi:MAG: HupE/UreJ family protein [Bacteroidetes bacterium]|nr:HupE/UreJ family protein [Bacteroidota bacterium]
MFARLLNSILPEYAAVRLWAGRRPVRFAGLVILLLAFLTALPAQAHESRPGYLELRETAPGRYEVLFKVPRKGGARLKMYATLPETCTPVVPTATYATPGALIERTTVTCEGGLVGQRIVIQGLEALLTDVLVRVQFLDGTSIMHRLRPNAPSFVVPAAPSAFDVAQTYLALGVEHILGGIDHLLFVLALLLLGVALMLGIGVRIAAIGGAILMAFLFLAGDVWPENNPVNSSNVIEMVVLLGIAYVGPGPFSLQKWVEGFPALRWIK